MLLRSDKAEMRMYKDSSEVWVSFAFACRIRYANLANCWNLFAGGKRLFARCETGGLIPETLKGDLSWESKREE